MNADVGGQPRGGFAVAGETVSIQFDLGLLWYLHEVGSGHLVADCDHSRCAAEATLVLEEAIICCEDSGQDEAAVQFRTPELLFLLGLVRRGDKDGTGRPVGLEAARRLMRARLLLQQGDIPTAPQGDRSYAEAIHDGGNEHE